MGGIERPVLYNALASRRLTWWPEIGVGYYPVEAGSTPYDRSYFERYAQQANTDIGRALMRARVDFVSRFYQGPLIDIGIGSGAFIKLRGLTEQTFGFDVCPAACDWLRAGDLWADPFVQPPQAISLWDVLEHIPDFMSLISNVSRWVFVSIPIFTDGEHVLRSKHYRKDEHVWYFEVRGLVSVMLSLGFACVEHSKIETVLGREDIGTFAFRRAST